MNLYARILRPLLFCLPPETAHHLSLQLLHFRPGRQVVSAKAKRVMGLMFPNPIGLAAGLDKNAAHIDALAGLGFGFIEVGTVTPNPRAGNPKPRLFRLPQAGALINRMGFPNIGLAAVCDNLSRTHYRGVLGINVSKDEATPPEAAIDDFVQCMQGVYRWASYITVNLSCPQEPELRALQLGEPLRRLLQNLKNVQADLNTHHCKQVPLVIKISPEHAVDELHDIADALLANEVEGVIATNTTTQRPSLESDPRAQQRGGLSGQPLLPASLAAVRVLRERLAGKVAIIGLGGITQPSAASDMKMAGADLLQVYTGLIYQGPQLIPDLAAAYMNADNHI